MNFDISSFNPLFSTSIVLNFAYIIASTSSKARLYLILGNRLKDSVNTISKNSIKVDYNNYVSLMVYASIQHQEDIAHEVQNIIDRKKANIRKNLLSSIALARKIVSVKYLSQSSFILGIYSFFILFIYPFKMSNFNSCLFLFNLTCLFTVTYMLFFCEYSKKLKWNLSKTTKFLIILISLAIIYLNKNLNLINTLESILGYKIDHALKKDIVKYNLYFTIFFPYTAIFYYFSKGYFGTGCLVRWYWIKVKYYKIKDKYSSSQDVNSILKRIKTPSTFSIQEEQ